MNETYEKPVIRFESFELSTTICGSCGAGANAGTAFGKPFFSDPYSCYYGDESGGMFLSASICADVVPESANGTLYCYNNPSGDTVMFSS